MGLLGGGPDVVVPEPSRTRPKQPPRKKDQDVQAAAEQQRRDRGRGRGETVLTQTLGGTSSEEGEQKSTLLGG